MIITNLQHFLQILKQGALHMYLMYFKINNLIKKQYFFKLIAYDNITKNKKRQIFIIVIILKMK